MITKRLLSALVVVAQVLVSGACSRDHQADVHDSHADHEHVHEGHSHGDEITHGGDELTLVYTHYTDSTELFLEFPPLVAGESSRFLAHVTRLEDFAPLTSGTLDVVLSQNGRAVARFHVKTPLHPGIFAPVVKPREAGTFELSLVIQDGDLRARHDLGEVQVFAEDAAVRIDTPEHQDGIRYLKEQQWSSPFATTVVAERPLRVSMPGFGVVQAPADAGAEIRAPSDGYFLAADLVRGGQSVKAGDPLGYLVPQLGEGADFGNLTVEWERARAQLDLAERDLARLTDLFAQGAVPERRLVEARHAHAVAQAELATARARREQYQRGSAQAGIVLRAPVSGEIVAAYVSPGAFVRTGERVFQVAAPDRRWLQVQVPERFAAGLTGASGAWIESESGEIILLGQEQGARTVQVATAVDPETRTASATIEYPTTAGPSQIGARFSARVVGAAEEAGLAIPRSAVIDDGGRPVVYVQTGGETFQRRTVELGRVDGRWVGVLRGLQPGERIVSEGAYYVKLAASSGDQIGHGHAH